MKFAAIGDNCIDVYEKLQRSYPTGNAVDTAVNMRRLGIPTAMISTTGNDEHGRIMINALRREGLDLSHFRIADGATAVTYMEMNGLDRVHARYVEGVLEKMTFSDEDAEFAASHDLVHSALWGKAEKVLPKIKGNGAPISFDYADRLDHPLIEATLPYVDYGFFSYHKNADEYIKSYLKDKVKRGMKLCVATLGREGSIAFDGEKYEHCAAFPAKIVNTVGAGDSFIAGFLYGLMSGFPIKDCLAKGAAVAAEVISVFEPWTGIDYL
jgi:fructoselysine 6-kinase